LHSSQRRRKIKKKLAVVIATVPEYATSITVTFGAEQANAN
jgi:hypothetical protein